MVPAIDTDKLPGRKFLHDVWINCIGGTAECEVVSANSKFVRYRSLEVDDDRVGRCRLKYFWSQVRMWKQAH